MAKAADWDGLGARNNCVHSLPGSAPLNGAFQGAVAQPSARKKRISRSGVSASGEAAGVRRSGVGGWAP